MTLPLIARALYETARISVLTVVDAQRGRLRPEVSSARLGEWSHRLLEQADVRLEVSGLEHLREEGDTVGHTDATHGTKTGSGGMRREGTGDAGTHGARTDSVRTGNAGTHGERKGTGETRGERRNVGAQSERMNGERARAEWHAAVGERRCTATSARSFVIMSNHQSLYDIPVLFCALPLSFRMVAKQELFRIPVWGRAMLAAQFVCIDRSRGAEAYRVMQERGLELRELGLSVWVAPEGTRSPNGRLLHFRKGGFALARCLELPILPVSIDGTRHVLGKKQTRITKGRVVRVIVHEPIDPGRASDDCGGIEALVDRVRRVIAAPLEGKDDHTDAVGVTTQTFTR
ncbi:MAG: 1-acyl-sn-glycerol-3-phosphate acyltransferase [Myxococcales bacterium]|jgi:1-acyl-sn-glycerol-3-phosphate acyltransferase|nr:1-acyl-sn-glycerol-3-phosphate acyltransferase [Myxococcales bacterium]